MIIMPHNNNYKMHAIKNRIAYLCYYTTDDYYNDERPTDRSVGWQIDRYYLQQQQKPVAAVQRFIG